MMKVTTTHSLQLTWNQVVEALIDYASKKGLKIPNGVASADQGVVCGAVYLYWKEEK